MTTINVAVVTPDAEPWPYAVVTVRLIDAGSGGAVEESVVTGISTIYCDADGEGTIALTPNEDISPAGTFYAFAVENSSPSTVRCIEVPDSGTALSWADPTIQVLVDDPPVFIPAPTLADALKVVRVNSSGDAYELGTSGAGDVAGDTHTATSKTTPVDADEIPLADSAASFALKKLTWANLKATAKTYFDTLYATVSHVHAGSDITSGTVGTARLGSGTANSGTYLRGDQTWAAVSGSSTVDVVSNVASNVLLGRTTAGSGDSEEITVAASRLVGRAASGDIDDLDAAAVKTLLAYAVGDVSGAAPLASPTFTGTPAAPSATGGTNTTQVATTAFVHAGQVASGPVIPAPSGLYTSGIPGATAVADSASLVANYIVATLMFIPYGLPFDQLAVSSNASNASATVRLGLYAIGTNGYPGLQVYAHTGTINTASTGVKSASVSGVGFGWCWAVSSLGGANNIFKRSATGVPIAPFINPTASSASTGKNLQAARTDAALPSDLSTGVTWTVDSAEFSFMLVRST